MGSFHHRANYASSLQIIQKSVGQTIYSSGESESLQPRSPAQVCITSTRTAVCPQSRCCSRQGSGPAMAMSFELTPNNLFSKACCNSTRSNGFKLREGRFRLDARKTFFTVKVVKHWHGLPREVGAAPSLETFQARLDGALSTPIQLKMALLMAEGWPR